MDIGSWPPSGWSAWLPLRKHRKTANTVLTALSSTTISGYVDTSAQWNFGTGNENNPPYTFGGASKADGFNLNVVQLSIAKPMDESEWAAGYQVDLWFGPDANSLGTQSVFGSGYCGRCMPAISPSARLICRCELRSATALTGKSVYSTPSSATNPLHPRTIRTTPAPTAQSIEPTDSHGYARPPTAINDNISVAAGVADTIGTEAINRPGLSALQKQRYAESYKTYMASLALTAPDSMGFLAGSTLYGGIVNGFNNGVLGTGYAAPTLNAYVGGTMATPVTGLRVGASWDYVRLDSTISCANVWNTAYNNSRWQEQS